MSSCPYKLVRLRLDMKTLVNLMVNKSTELSYQDSLRLFNMIYSTSAPFQLFCFLLPLPLFPYECMTLFFCRIFDTNSVTTRCLMEFRRGADPCNLHCLQFSPCSSFLAASSDKVWYLFVIHVLAYRHLVFASVLFFKGTIHIFTLRDTDDARRGILHKVGLPNHFFFFALYSFDPSVF